MPSILRNSLAAVVRSAVIIVSPITMGVVATLGIASTVHAEQPAGAQAANQQISDRIRIVGDDAYHWTIDGARTVMIEKNVRIETDDATMTADRAVVWLANDPGGNYTVQIALLGNAKLVRGDVIREAPELLVNSNVKPDVKLEVLNLTGQDKSTDVHYLAATQLRRQAREPAKQGQTPPSTPDLPPSNPATTVQETGANALPTDTATGTGTGTGVGLAATQPSVNASTTKPIRPKSVINFRYDRAKMETTETGTIAVVLSGKVALLQTTASGDRVELQADHVVVFTRWTNIREVFEGDKLSKLDAEKDIDAVYLEGDVRIGVTPATKDRPEQSLRAARAVYEFGSERAILTDALLHTNDPKLQAPLVMRAQTMKKIGKDEYEAENASITTSSFATPSISLSARKITVREEPTGDKRDPTKTAFKAVDVIPRAYGLPLFWFPRLWGTMEDGATPLRDISLTNSTGFGFGIETKWGLFQTLGMTPPQGLDASYRLDYYTERGPGLGLDANYSGGFVDQATLQPWNYSGNFTAYGVFDDGQDRLGKQRGRPQHDNDFRGRVKWNHQQFLTDNWQLQARIGYTSDASFLEEWFRSEFFNGLEQDASLYLKRSKGSEVFSGLLSYDISKVATVADQLQEVDGAGKPGARSSLFVEKLPEVQYHRIGESIFDDQMTLISNNSVAGLHFSKSYATLGDIGLRDRDRTQNNDGDVGIPSYGYTGITNDYIVRGDFRQEIDHPLGNDQYRIVPYAMVRYTAYSNSPDDSAVDRILGGVGIRGSTQFYKVYNGVSSDLFDIHRMRHVVEPQFHLFASAQTTDRNELYQFEEGVDGVSDIAAANFNIRQRFQTKRGGPGRERSVDFLTVNTGVVFFANEPDEIQNPSNAPNYATADGFRGVFFNGMPEASIARSTAYADTIWRVTDTTALLSDAAMNVQDGDLATAAVGVAFQRDPRARYYAGIRYIGEMNSTIGTVSFDYDISERYAISVNQSFNFTENTSQNTNLQLIRRFEQFVFTVTFYLDQVDDEGGVSFSLSPRNLPFSFGVGDGNGGRR